MCLLQGTAALKAGNTINLKPGFTANSGCNLTISVGTVTSDKYYYLKDHLGSIRVVVDTVGEIVSYSDYDPWGIILNGRSSNFGFADDKYKFTGKERDLETGYDYFPPGRTYDSELGRWLQVDPLADKYPNVSPYNYALNNPLRYIDPKGLEPGDNDGAKKRSWWGMISSYLESFVSVFQEKNKNIDYNPEKNISDARDVKTLKKFSDIKLHDPNISDNIYFSSMVGKQSTASAEFGLHGGFSFSSGGIYTSTGLDAVVSTSTTTSLSISAGITDSPNLAGQSFMLTGGLFGVGAEFGPTVNFDGSISWSAGLVFSTSYIWIGGTSTTNNILYKFKQ